MTEAGDVSLGWETVKSFVAKMIQAVIGFVGTIVFARILGPTSFGGFYLLLTLVFVATRPIDGVGQALRKRYSEQAANRSEIVGGVLVAVTAYFAVVTAVIAPLNGLLEDQTQVEFAAVVFLTLLLSRGLFKIFQFAIGATGQISKQTWNDTFRSILTLPFQLGLVLAGLGSAGMGFGLAGATLIAAGAGVVIVDLRPRLPERDTIRLLWQYAKYGMPSAVVGRVYSRLDILLLGLLATTGVIGYYEVALKLTLPATFLSTVIFSGLMPRISNLKSRGEEVAVEITNAVSYTSILSIPVFFGALALSESLVVTFYGPDYADAAGFLVGLALYQVVSTQSGAYMQTLMGLDHPEIKLRINVLTLVFNVITGVALVLAVGPIGVVVATVCAETGKYLMGLHAVSKRVNDVEYLPRPLSEQFVAGLIMYVFVETAHAQVSITSWFKLVVIVGASAVVYFLTLLALSTRLRLTLRSIYADAVSD